MNIQYVTDDKGSKTHVLLPLEDFESLIDNRDFDEAMADNGEILPDELVIALLNGENKIKAWRNYRGLTQTQLANSIKKQPAYISMLESGKRSGDIETIKSIASVLGVDLGDLV